MNALLVAAQILSFSFLTVLMTVGLKLMRRRIGRFGYWSAMSALCAGVFALQFVGFAIFLYSMVILIGVFSELEEMGFSLNVSAFFTLALNGLLSAAAFAMWAYANGPRWTQTLVSQVEAATKASLEANPELQIGAFDLMLQMPSVILIVWMVGLYLAILFETRVNSARGDEQTLSMRRQLAEFRVPDMVVWLFIAALLGRFGGFGNETVEAVAANVLNIATVLFVFQGIAVVSRVFEAMRMTPAWQMFFMVLIVAYLAPFVSMIGLVDHWFDFRLRLAKRAEELNRETDMN